MEEGRKEGRKGTDYLPGCSLQEGFVVS